MISGLEELSSFQRDIRELNKQYLCLLRDMAKSDIMMAQQQFGVSGLICKRVARLSLDDIQELADSPSFIFTLRSSQALEAMLTALTAQDHDQIKFNSLRLATVLCDQATPASRFREAVNQ